MFTSFFKYLIFLVSNIKRCYNANWKLWVPGWQLPTEIFIVWDPRGFFKVGNLPNQHVIQCTKSCLAANLSVVAYNTLIFFFRVVICPNQGIKQYYGSSWLICNPAFKVCSKISLSLHHSIVGNATACNPGIRFKAWLLLLWFNSLLMAWAKPRC